MKKRFYRFLSLCLAIVMLLGLAACGQKPATGTEPNNDGPQGTEAQQKEEITLNLWVQSMVGSNELLLSEEEWWINKAIAEVEEKSGGRLKIACVPAGGMGSEEELIPQVFAGTVDMSLSGPSVWGTVGSIDAIGWSELP